MQRMRAHVEEANRRDLVPHAPTSAGNRGRRRTEHEDPHLTAWMRERVSHSGAFRSLTHTTPVVVNRTGDSSRTCLTHTLNVARITRSALRALRLCETPVGTAALTHGSGHPLFGH